MSPHPLHSPLRKIGGLLALIAGSSGAQAAPAYPDQEIVCGFNAPREQQRSASALSFAAPQVQQMSVNGAVVWVSGVPGSRPVLRPGHVVSLQGSGFGRGTDIDFSKIMVGNSRVLETNVTAYVQQLDLIAAASFETGVVKTVWPKDVLSWSDTEVRFQVPAHASRGPLKLQVQKRLGYNQSLLRPGTPHQVIDAQVYRITAPADANCDVVSVLSDTARAIAPIDVDVINPDFNGMLTLGRQIFWSYDFNLGLSHKFKALDWDKILNYRSIDPYTRRTADPAALFGAYRVQPSEVPAEAWRDVRFDPYPQTNPTPGALLFTPQLTKGKTSSTGWVGYRKAESSHPLLGNGSWAGFNCASCHGVRVSYSKGSENLTKVFPGPPNPGWSMKWSVLGDRFGESTANFSYIAGDEPGPSWAPGKAAVDKTALLYHMPAGTGEHRMVRTLGEGSLYDNDYQFSPIAIPNVTFHLPIRRSLSHTESYVGFEGSYVHSQEPDGALGSMDAASLKALTAYMSTLDGGDDDLRNVGMYRWLASRRGLAQTGSSTTSEGSFVAKGWQQFPGVVAAVQAGKASFDRQCGACHADQLGAHTNEKMIPLNQVGRFFAPTDYHALRQSIRVSFLRNLYWVSSRGLLSDGHVRNLEDLVDPARCTEGSALYQQYYTLHQPVRPAAGTPDQPLTTPDLNRKGDVFRVPKARQSSIFDSTSPARNRFIERHKYFVTPAFDTQHYYWDFQKMRREYGPEIGAQVPIGLPATPHPWCAGSSAEIQDMVQYLLTL